MTHTPGPWVDHEEDGCITAELTEDGEDMPEGVCLILGGPHAEANADLIMAAPDLLDAAQNALRELEAYRILLDGCEAWIDAAVDEELRNAIAKARGES